ncbi:hypothetical protein PSEUDO9AG_40767 [Pseudomonas sp. 9Ag]|nr:hypothetical protein PSEUDO9AG_40767 [Pseudomonas sp. 9Ag]
MFWTLLFRALLEELTALLGRLKSITMIETSNKSGRLPAFRQILMKL